MTIRFYNTLTQRLEDFVPKEPGKVRMYVCGLTTYDLAHAGHGRSMTTFDVLARHLKARGFEVTFVRNVTDVDDKILKRAAELGEEPTTFSARMAKGADEDLAAIGNAKPSHEPRVSQTIPEIIALIKTLIEKNHAYAVDTPKGKDVYFSVRSFPNYGKLSHRNIDDLLSGARIETGEIKHDPLDFALWKGDSSKEAWGFDSPWGKGRPGWHIECSAMAHKLLGPHFDIHGGAMDLIFPHHENEIAQSEAAWGPEFSNVWLHGGFLNADNEKMSKSLGNFVTIRDVLARNDAEAFRYYLLGTHYRGPLAFELEKTGDRVSFPGIDEAERRMDYLYNTRELLDRMSEEAHPRLNETAAANVIGSAPYKVLDALDRDLNAPQALAVVAELAKVANELVTAKGKKDDAHKSLSAAAAKAFREVCEPLGLMQATAENYAQRTRAQRLRIRSIDAAAIDGKIEERRTARANKDFARADAIRQELTTLNIEVLDSPTGSTWRVLV